MTETEKEWVRLLVLSVRIIEQISIRNSDGRCIKSKRCRQIPNDLTSKADELCTGQQIKKYNIMCDKIYIYNKL